jgi:hypothetical protein
MVEILYEVAACTGKCEIAGDRDAASPPGTEADTGVVRQDSAGNSRLSVLLYKPFPFVSTRQLLRAKGLVGRYQMSLNRIVYRRYD